MATDMTDIKVELHLTAIDLDCIDRKSDKLADLLRRAKARIEELEEKLERVQSAAEDRRFD